MRTVTLSCAFSSLLKTNPLILSHPSIETLESMSCAGACGFLSGSGGFDGWTAESGMLGLLGLPVAGDAVLWVLMQPAAKMRNNNNNSRFMIIVRHLPIKKLAEGPKRQG